MGYKPIYSVQLMCGVGFLYGAIIKDYLTTFDKIGVVLLGIGFLLITGYNFFKEMEDKE